MFNLTKSISFKLQRCILRNYATKKRFYKNSSVLQSEGKYEVTLDQRKLKTPSGTPFIVESEPLAIAVSTEWNNQKDTIELSSMHLTSLCNTAIDNPNKLTKLDIVNYISNYIATDTVLFFSQDCEELLELQTKEWRPVIDWFNKTFETHLQITKNIASPEITAETRMNISRYLMSFDLSALHGFVFAVDTLKSIVLAFACTQRFITIEKAVFLSRLEEEYQLKYWERIEWAHDLSQFDLQARLSAAILFIYFNSSNAFIKEKIVI